MQRRLRNKEPAARFDCRENNLPSPFRVQRFGYTICQLFLKSNFGVACGRGCAPTVCDETPV